MATLSGPQPNLRARWLGERLRELRRRQKVSLKQAGDHLQRDGSTISRYEVGDFPIRRVDLLALLDLYAVSDEPERRDILHLGDELWRRGWWDQHVADIGKDYINVPWLESHADEICSYQDHLVPGLLQTTEYAEAVIRRFSTQDDSDEQIKRWIMIRKERSEILTGESRKAYTAAIEESVIRNLADDQKTARVQLSHLMNLEETNAIVRIIPMKKSNHRATHSFNLYRMSGPYPTVGHIETQVGHLYVEHPNLSTLEEIWDDLMNQALDRNESRQLIADYIEELK